MVSTHSRRALRQSVLPGSWQGYSMQERTHRLHGSLLFLYDKVKRQGKESCGRKRWWIVYIVMGACVAKYEARTHPYTHPQTHTGTQTKWLWNLRPDREVGHFAVRSKASGKAGTAIFHFFFFNVLSCYLFLTVFLIYIYRFRSSLPFLPRWMTSLIACSPSFYFPHPLLLLLSPSFCFLSRFVL